MKLHHWHLLEILLREILLPLVFLSPQYHHPVSTNPRHYRRKLTLLLRLRRRLTQGEDFFSFSRTQKTRERDFHRCLDKRRGKHGDKRGGRPTQAHTFAQKKINIANARMIFFFARELQDSGSSSFIVNFFLFDKEKWNCGCWRRRLFLCIPTNETTHFSLPHDDK